MGKTKPKAGRGVEVHCSCSDCKKKLKMKITDDSCILVLDKRGNEEFYCGACLAKFFKGGMK